MNNNNESLDARAIAKAQSAQGGSEKKNHLTSVILSCGVLIIQD